MVAAAFSLDLLAHIGDDLGTCLFNKTGRRTAHVPTSAVSRRGALATYAVLASFEDSFTRRSSVLDAMRDVGREIRIALDP